MQALLVDHDTPSQVTLGEAPEPVPGRGEVLMDVECFSIIERNLRHAAITPSGCIPGYDAVGTLVRTADDGSAPPPGTRVVTLGQGGAWAQRRAVPVAELAVVPPEVDPGLAAVLAVPGVSALRATRRLGSVLGRRVLVTGATGAVGHFAVQLARRAGAHVIASARTRDRAGHLRDLGADEVVTDLAEITSPVTGVIESVGGPLLGQAYDLLEEGGSVQSVGSGSGEPSTLRTYQLIGPHRRIEGFHAGDRFGADLAWLLGEAAAGRLALLDGERDDWTRVDDVAARLVASTHPSRAVLTVHGTR